MRHTIIEFPTSRNVHIAEEVMLPFRGVIKGRVLCGGLRDKNVYEKEIASYLAKNHMSREAWFQPVKRIEMVSCKKCMTRHHRFMDEYEEYRAEYDPEPAKKTQIILTPDECVLDKTGTCLRTDKVHAEAGIEAEKSRWWVCPTHD